MKILGSRHSLQTQGTAGNSVGYGRPPVATRFKPGKSGNPAGPAPGYKSMVAILRRFLDMDITDLQKQLGANPAMLLQAKGKTVGEVLALMHLAVCQSPVKGHSAREALMDRTEGRPSQAVDVTSGGEQISWPLVVRQLAEDMKRAKAERGD